MTTRPILAVAPAPSSSLLSRALLLLWSATFVGGHEVTLVVAGSSTVPSTTGNAIFGTYPPVETLAAQTPTVLPSVAVFTMDAQCSMAPFAGHAGLDGQTLLLLNGDACRARYDALLMHLAALQPTTIRAIISTDPPAGDVLPPNYAMLPASVSPPFLRGRWTPSHTSASSIVQASNAWGQALAAHVATAGGGAAAGRVAVEVSPLYVVIEQPGLAYEGSVALGHINWYLHEHASAEPLTITVTPLYGNPDLYVRDASTLTSLVLPGGANGATHSQTSPGDDALTVALGPQRHAVAIGVFGRLASNFSVVVSAPSTEVQLTSGLPRRFELPAGATQYFAIDTDRSSPFIVWVTPITGAPPSLYLSADNARPDAATATASAAAGPSVAYQRLALAPGDPALAGCPAAASLCRVHLSTVASAASTFSLVVTTGARERIRLIDGVPQRGVLEAAATAGGASGQLLEAHYVVRVANSRSNLTLSLALESGRDAHLRLATADGAHSWSSEGQGTGGQGAGTERLHVPSDELSAACTGCDLHVTVVAASHAVYTLSATSSDGLLLLPDGVPVREFVSEGSYEHFKLEVLLPSADVEIVVQSLASSDVDVYAARPSRPLPPSPHPSSAPRPLWSPPLGAPSLIPSLSS